MTKWEKFKEVFGIPQDITIEPEDSICPIMHCSDTTCSSCPIADAGMDLAWFWDEEYEESEVK